MPLKKKKISKKVSKKVKRKLILPTKKTIVKQRLSDYITLFYGPPGVGKTTFVNGFNEKVFFISTDRGTRDQSALRLECNSYSDLQKIMGLIKSNPGIYNMICVDHIDDIAFMIEDDICQTHDIEGLGDLNWGTGWKLFRTAMQRFVGELKSTGLGIVFIAHEVTKEVKINGIKVDRIMPDLSRRPWKSIIPLCSLVGYCGFKVIRKNKVRKEIRVVETIPTRNIYCKDRTRRTRPVKGYDLLNSQKFVETF